MAESASEKSKRAGRKTGTVNISAEEKEYLLDLAKEILPIGQRHWARLATKLNDKFHNNRDRISSNRKRFNEWVNSKGGGLYRTNFFTFISQILF